MRKSRASLRELAVVACYRWFSFALPFTLLVHGSSLPADDSVATAERPFRIVGYLPEYQISKIDSSVGKLATDVIFFSLQLTSDGGLDRLDLSDEEILVLRAIRQHGARLHVSLGGGNRSQYFAEVTADNRLRARLVANVNQFAERYELHGVDVDWEYPRGEKQNADFARLLAALKVALAPKGREVSIAVSAWQELPAATIEAVDLVHLMAYDNDGQHSTYDFAVAQTQRVLQRGVPASKLCLGVPFYGRNIENRNQTLSYAEILRRHQLTVDADEAASYFFNGPRTLEQKLRFARDKGLAGIMIWELGQDGTDERSLLRAVHAAATARP